MYREMRIVFGALVVLWTMFVMLIGLAVLIGYGQPPSPAVRQLHLLDCAPPCWIGIVPGETRIDVAYSRFAAVFDLSDHYLPEAAITSASDPTMSVYVELTLPSYSNARVRLPFSEGVTKDVIFVFWENGEPSIAPSVGDIFSLFGSPACLDSSMLVFTGGWRLIYDAKAGMLDIGISGMYQGQNLHQWWFQSVSYVGLHQPISDLGICHSLSGYPSWRGPHLNRYLRLS